MSRIKKEDLEKMYGKMVEERPYYTWLQGKNAL